MKLAMRLPESTGKNGAANDIDPREEQPAEIIDLASRNAYPAVGKGKGKSDMLAMVAGIAIVAALGAVTLWSMNSTRVTENEPIGNPQVAPPQQASVAPAQIGNSPQTSPAVVPLRDPAPAPVLAAPPQPMAGTGVNPNNSPTIVFDAGARSLPSVAAAGLAADAAAAGNTGGGSAGDFASRIGGVGGAAAQATPMTNPATTITQGTLIPAILETAINTDVPGYVRAVVSQDVLSFDGTRTLLPRSSRLIGQYQSGVQNGQKRAYVIWTRAIRPDGASVSLGSPAVGFDGTTGLTGDVDNKFFSRFGSAMLLSVVGGLSAIGSGGASVVLGGAGQGAASVAAQQDSQIGPTIRVRQGEPIRVFTARDLDFSQVPNR
ncbi:MAG: TrbI/VirB10 family protein [Alteripontixanthobacter sp.]